MIIFLSISLNICSVCSKEPSNRDSSFEYPQHMFWLRNKKIIFIYTLLSGGLGIQDSTGTGDKNSTRPLVVTSEI